MMRNTWKLLIVAAMVLSGCGKGKDSKTDTKAGGGADKAVANATYTIKFKKYPDVGKSVTERSTEKTTGTVKVSDDKGKVLSDEKQDQTRERVLTLTVLEGGDQRPKKYKETYEKAIDTAAGKAMPLSYQGKTLLYELKGDKYEVTAEGGGVSPNDLRILASKANNAEMDDVLAPKKPVKIGESWTIDIKDVVNAFGRNDKGESALEEDKSKVEAKLVKVTDNKIGTIEVKMTLVSKPNAFVPGMTMEGTSTLETAIDGSSVAGKVSSNGTTTGKGDVTQAGMKSHMDINLKMTEEKERSAEK
jgi:hypothetical protein